MDIISRTEIQKEILRRINEAIERAIKLRNEIEDEIEFIDDMVWTQRLFESTVKEE